MEADFTIRNEVESLEPPSEEYESPKATYGDIISGINSAPPFPTNKSISYSPNNFLPASLFYQQQRRLDRNHKILINQILKNKEADKWKWISLCCLSFILFFLYERSQDRAVNFAHRMPQKEKISRYLEELD